MGFIHGMERKFGERGFVVVHDESDNQRVADFLTGDEEEDKPIEPFTLRVIGL